jgi:hypothetical protein
MQTRYAYTRPGGQEHTEQGVRVYAHSTSSCFSLDAEVQRAEHSNQLHERVRRTFLSYILSYPTIHHELGRTRS